MLGSTVSPGVGGSIAIPKKRGKRNTKEDMMGLKGAGALSKSEVGKMLSKALKVYIGFLYSERWD